MKEELIKFCDHQIERLTDKLDAIYTIVDYGKRVNVCKELERLDFLESVYSVVEANDFHEGFVYEEYISYLNAVREEKAKYIQEKEKIDEKENKNIKNINLLLREIKHELIMLQK